MVGHEGSSAGSYLADPTSPIPSHCAVIILSKSIAVHQLSWLALKELNLNRSPWYSFTENLSVNHLLHLNIHLCQCSRSYATLSSFPYPFSTAYWNPILYISVKPRWLTHLQVTQIWLHFIWNLRLYYLTLKVLVATIDAQWEEMGDVGSARYKPALLPPCPP